MAGEYIPEKDRLFNCETLTDWKALAEQRERDKDCVKHSIPDAVGYYKTYCSKCRTEIEDTTRLEIITEFENTFLRSNDGYWISGTIPFGEWDEFKKKHNINLKSNTSIGED